MTDQEFRRLDREARAVAAVMATALLLAAAAFLWLSARAP